MRKHVSRWRRAIAIAAVPAAVFTLGACADDGITDVEDDGIIQEEDGAEDGAEDGGILDEEGGEDTTTTGEEGETTEGE